jgi:hypothetical protein
MPHQSDEAQHRTWLAQETLSERVSCHVAPVDPACPNHVRTSFTSVGNEADRVGPP